MAWCPGRSQDWPHATRHARRYSLSVDSGAACRGRWHVPCRVFRGIHAQGWKASPRLFTVMAANHRAEFAEPRRQDRREHRQRGRLHITKRVRTRVQKGIQYVAKDGLANRPRRHSRIARAICYPASDRRFVGCGQPFLASRAQERKTRRTAR